VKVLLLVFLTSFFVVLLSTPSLIKVALLKRLFDEPDSERKFHGRRVPSIGGIIIFAGILFSFALWLPIGEVPEYSLLIRQVNDFKYLVATLLILFFVGIKDDIIGTAPIKKLAAHVVVGMILVIMADVRLTGLHGLFGVWDLPYWGSIFLSLFTYIVVVNAFNLIDGVDGLASGIGFIASASFGTWFMMAGDVVSASLAYAMAGSLLAFLIFNFSPAKIFLGDSGSLTLGLLICYLAIKLIEFDKTDVNSEIISHVSKPTFAMAVLVYPLLDTLRIFIYRTIRGISPFAADRNHIHHRLQDIGLTHRWTAVTLYIFNLLIVGLALYTRNYSPSISFAIVGCGAVVFVQIPFLVSKKKNRQKGNQIEGIEE